MRIVDNYLSSTSTVKSVSVERVVQIKLFLDSHNYVAVESIDFDGYEDVYNMEVDTFHNFAVEEGCIVHNCLDATRYALERYIRGANFKIPKG